LPQGGFLIVQHPQHCLHVNVDQRTHEAVWMDCLDPVLVHKRVRKVPEIERDYVLGVGADGRCEHVSIVGIGHRKPVDQRLVTSHERFAHGLVDEPSGPLNTGRSRGQAGCGQGCRSTRRGCALSSTPAQSSFAPGE
jgi:hypothetical protein